MEYEFSEKFELHIIRGILSDPSIFTRVQSILKPEYFENNPVNSNKHCIEMLHQYYNEHKALPIIDLINDKLKHKNPQEWDYIIYPEWNKITDSEILITGIEKFCRNRACVNASLLVYDNFTKGNFDNVVKTIEDALAIKLPSDFGIMALSADGVSQELKKLHEIQNELKTGWTMIDKVLQGGFGYGEINTFCAMPGGGKSLCLINLGVNYARQGLNVMYFSLELSEANIKKRIVAMVSGYNLRDMKGNEDDVEIQYNEVLNDKIWTNHGDFQIIYTPGGTKPIDIQTIVNEYELKFEKIVNVIIVDYVDLMSPNGKISNENIHQSQRSVYEDLRGWAANRTKKDIKTTIFTASQFGKGSMKENEDEIGQGSLSGSAYKTYTSDNVIAIHNVKENINQKNLTFLKTRNSAGSSNPIPLAFNPNTLLLSDFDILSSGRPEIDALLKPKETRKRELQD